MKDPERIDRIINKLRDVWKCYPDYRLGQLISNLQGPHPQDIFFSEDEDWERWLDLRIHRLVLEWAERYGDRRAFPNPDYRSEFNEP